jgi:archaetidylinositol phosphate synthase
MLATRHKEAFSHFLDPIIGLCVRLGVHPTAITLAGMGLSAAVCIWLMVSRAILPFIAAIVAVGLLDVVDGPVARASGRVSKFGAYMDAVADRVVEFMVVLAVAWVTGYWALSFIALAGAMLVSYSKARAGMEVQVSNREWPDLMERGERTMLYLGGLLAGQLIPWQPWGRDLFWWALVALSVFTGMTVVQRVLRARRIINERG